MKPTNICYEIAGRDQTTSAVTLEQASDTVGIRLEACEFERLLERAAEILSLRGRMAA